MVPRRPLAALGAAALLALAACSDGPFGPIGALAGERYLLTHVNGAPLPALLWGDPAGARLELLGEALAFRPFGRVERTRIVRFTGADGSVETSRRPTVSHYRVRDEPTEVSAPGVVLRIVGASTCPPPSPSSLSVACEPEEQAVVSGDELRLTSIVYGAMSATTITMRFERYEPADYVDGDALP